ncbi:MAG: hypothetical protein J6C46_05345 [Clostridia bacterium]|nr:hypothetical protein [Clostridia bacterium]
MSNNKGVTIVTVIVMIIVMLLIATVSIVAGNKIIVNSNELKAEQELQSVKSAVLRKKSEVNMAGSLIPIGEAYIGIKDPILKSDDSGTIKATNWYLLDETNLEKLGIYDSTSRYIVNYDYEQVLSTKNKEYIEEYMLIECIQKYIANNSVVGLELKNKTSVSGSTTVTMVRDNETGNVYGTGWHLLRKTATGELPTEYAEYIKHDYLINFNTAQYIKMDSNFEEI